MKHSLEKPHTAPQKPRGHAAHTRKQRVLLVESDPTFRRALSGLFTKQGYFISAAANLTDALEFLSQLHYSLIIYNLDDASHNGFNKLETILKNAGKARVLVTSSFSEQSVINHVKQTGAYACLTKPIKRATILQAAQ